MRSKFWDKIDSTETTSILNRKWHFAQSYRRLHHNCVTVYKEYVRSGRGGRPCCVSVSSMAQCCGSTLVTDDSPLFTLSVDLIGYSVAEEPLYPCVYIWGAAGLHDCALRFHWSATRSLQKKPNKPLIKWDVLPGIQIPRSMGLFVNKDSVCVCWRVTGHVPSLLGDRVST